jgi:hypothetical protein
MTDSAEITDRPSLPAAEGEGAAPGAGPAPAAAPPAPPAPPPTNTPPACLNCGAPVTRGWCSACGQKATVARLSMRHLVHEVPHAIFHVDRGIVPTLRGLVTRPGVMVTEYLEGKRARYFNPLTLLIICSAICGGVWSLFPLRQELLWPLLPGLQKPWLEKLVALWFKLVGSTQLLWLPLLAYVLHYVWMFVLYRTLGREGRLRASLLRGSFGFFTKSERSAVRADPRMRLFGESMAAASFVTSISLLITAAFAPLFALAQTPEQMRILVIVAGLLSSISALQLLLTTPPPLRAHWFEGIINAVLFALGTPLGFLFHLLVLNSVTNGVEWLARST